MAPPEQHQLRASVHDLEIEDDVPELRRGGQERVSGEEAAGAGRSGWPLALARLARIEEKTSSIHTGVGAGQSGPASSVIITKVSIHHFRYTSLPHAAEPRLRTPNPTATPLALL